MMFGRVNREKVLQIFENYYNATASTIAADAVVQMLGGASADGVSITTPTTGSLDLVIGVAHVAIPTASYGIVQIYGYRATSSCNNGTDAGAVGDKLVPVASNTYLASVAAGDGRDGHFVAMESYASSSASKIRSIKIFIRCM